MNRFTKLLWIVCSVFIMSLSMQTIALANISGVPDTDIVCTNLNPCIDGVPVSATDCTNLNPCVNGVPISSGGGSNEETNNNDEDDEIDSCVLFEVGCGNSIGQGSNTGNLPSGDGTGNTGTDSEVPETEPTTFDPVTNNPVEVNEFQAGRTTTYFHADAVGSVVAASDESGDLLWRKAYQPFGAQIQGGNETEDTSFTGKQLDKDTGLTYFGARYYDPVIGRFTSQDPVSSLNSVDSNPYLFNRYAYANNNPYRYVDPDGNNPKLLVDFALNVAINYATTGKVDIIGAVVDTAKDAVNPLATLNKARKVANIVKAASKSSDKKADAEKANKLNKVAKSGDGAATKGGVPQPTRHSVNQKINREVKSSDELDAIKNPLKKTDVKLDSQGRPSEKFIGEKASVAVNPQNNKIVTVHPTGSKTAQRLNRQKEKGGN